MPDPGSQSVLHGPAEGGAGESTPIPPASVKGQPRPKPQTCPECSQEFRPIHSRQLFCCSEHKAAFHNRATVRGRTLTPMAMAARITRDGTRGDLNTGRMARRESRRLIDAWAREDREAGRMDMAAYMRARFRIGY